MESEQNSKAPFTPGVSGNPKGRPKGALNKATLAAQRLLAGEAEALTRKAIDLAKEGNLVAIRLCLERILAPVKAGPIRVALPPVKTAGDAQAAYDSLFAGLSKGTLTVEDAVGLARLLEARFQALDLQQLTAQLAQLKEGLK